MSVDSNNSVENPILHESNMFSTLVVSNRIDIFGSYHNKLGC